ncbi:MAG: hypothetical protein JWO59_720 [Chloroflexi bacterium]|nr:hypothetical protein [Chloroflexota bacterium]
MVREQRPHSRKKRRVEDNERYDRAQLHAVSTQAETDLKNGESGRIRRDLPREIDGTFALKESLVRMLDKPNPFRPAFTAYLCADLRDDDALLPLLPLTIDEARVLLVRRAPKLAMAVSRCFFDDETEAVVGREQDPPRAQQTISDWKHDGIGWLALWTMFDPPHPNTVIDRPVKP